MVLQVSDRREFAAVLAEAPTVAQNLLRSLAQRQQLALALTGIVLLAFAVE